ncbi:Potassium voltage-gated channel protein eag [Clonorchis sinensis]|uniref:Potassium voltage-gated channel protein eag n=2 Tax=Clonorchis sinensis TaxID=79923 RepID=A0A8T1MF83_CLOSI|nr:Potassium voltage-gated channel protein eag [Clonorchis sinensis]GAA53184.1 potassium voltage-gated channel Eag-related subfamily H invertebrate [Clonorchis sinensis]
MMAGSRKGLVAPQNTFLETVLRRFGAPQTGLLVANARIVDYPIIYVNDSFTRLTNYSPRDMVQTSALCKQLHGERTSINAVERIQRALDEGQMEQVEITLYKKNKSMIWVVMCVAPIENDAGEIRLYLILLYDISPLRQPLDDDVLRGSFSKFAKLARSVARNRNMLASQSEMDDSTASLAPVQKENIPKYREESPRTPPHVLLHYVTFKTAWDWMIFLLTGYTSVVVPYSVAFGQGNTYGGTLLTAFDRIVDIIFCIDIVLNFHTTFVGPTGAVISDPTLIRLNYLKGWFMVDLIACLPYGLLNIFGSRDDGTIASLFNTLKVVRLLRLWRVLRKLDQYLKYVATILLIMILCFILLAHWLACVWYMVGMHDLQSHVYHGWILHLMNETLGERNWTDKAEVDNQLPPQSMLYMTSLYFTLSLITSIGFGNVAANTTVEKIVSIMFMIIGALVYATIFGNVTTILQQTHASRARLQQLMASVKDFLRIHSVPKELAERVIDYVTSSWSLTRGVDTDTVLNHCPKDMKADLCIHLYRAVFSEHPAFRLASESCLRALAVSFTAQHTAPGDLIFHQGESIDQLCFVISGSLEVIQDDEVVAILSKGDVFGQPVWKEADVGQSAASVRALTYCDLHCIKRDNLLEVLKFYSAFANSFSRSLVLTYNLRNRLVFRKISDVERERELSELRRNQPPLSSLAPDHPVRRLISRFCTAASSNVSQISRSSSASSNEPRDKAVPETPLHGSVASSVTTTTPTPVESSTAKPKLSRWGRLLDVPDELRPTSDAKPQEMEQTSKQAQTVPDSDSLQMDSVGQARLNELLEEQSESQAAIMSRVEELRSSLVIQLDLVSKYMQHIESKMEQVSSVLSYKR